jgi:uncharacterized cupin superfamily protein
MTDTANIHEPAWDGELPDAPFRLRGMRLGPRAGMRELGATLYELDEGGAVSPYHLHHANEELLVVVSGRPELRTPDGTRRLEPGAVVGFPRGEEGAHGVTNPGPGPARVLLVSTMNFPDVAEHVDTGGVLTITGPEQGRAFPRGAEIEPMELILGAMDPAARSG